MAGESRLAAWEAQAAHSQEKWRNVPRCGDLLIVPKQARPMCHTSLFHAQWHIARGAMEARCARRGGNASCNRSCHELWRSGTDGIAFHKCRFSSSRSMNDCTNASIPTADQRISTSLGPQTSSPKSLMFGGGSRPIPIAGLTRVQLDAHPCLQSVGHDIVQMTFLFWFR